jgi:hypothetical protein
MEEPLRTAKVTGEYLEVQLQRFYRGKTAGYFREETTVLQIVDKSGHEVKALWETDWRESAPGIETRDWRGSIGTRAGRSETYLDKGIRIYQHACPVRIQFLYVDEYIDYDNEDLSFTHRKLYWVQYEV